MKKLLYLIIPVSFVLIQSCSRSGSQGNDEAAFYSVGDFASVAKIDMHYHFNTDDSGFMEQARTDNFRLLDIVDDRPFGVPMDELQRIALTINEAFPEELAFASTFSVKDWNNEEWEKQTINYLDSCISNGAIAVKIWKNIGMDLRDSDGRFVMIDDPRLDTILDFLAGKNITLIGHNGEPKDCWLSPDKMTVKGNQNYYSEHPEYHMYLHPEYPSYEDQINARDNMLAKHPGLKFIGCHLGSLEWGLEELGKRLDKYPGMAVDLSRMTNLHLHAKNDWQKTHDFFIKYQDRLIYGTDRSVNKTDNLEGMKKSVHNGWLNDWRFFVTDEAVNSSGIDGEVRGLKLPSGVVDKLYRVNAEKWLPGI